MDESKQDLIKRIVRTRRRCAEDAEFFVSNFCHTIDARKNPYFLDNPSDSSIFLMKLWPQQKRLLKLLLKYENIIIEKSREMGISWLIMAFELHQVMFTEGFNALNISLKETEVEDPGKTYNSLMGRLDFMYQRLPDFLKLKMANPFLTFRIDSNNSIIKGDSANPNAGRDSQYSFIFVDEAAHIGCLDEMWKGVSNASNFICLNSTPPKGADNKYIRLLNMKNSGFNHFRTHWSEHPMKDANWYAKKIRSMDEEEIAQELEINHERSRTSRVYAEFNEADHVSTYLYYYNKNYPLILGFDFGLEGEAVGFYQKDANDRLFKLWQYEEKDLLTYQHVVNIDKILGKLHYHGKHTEILCYGDPAGNVRGRVSKESVITEYNKYGFHIKSKRISFDEKRRTVKTVLRNKINGKQQFSLNKPNDDNNCEKFSKAMLNARMNKLQSDQVDDWSTHKVNEFEYVVCNLFPLVKGAAVMVSVEREPRNEGRRHTIGASVFSQGMNQRKGLIFNSSKPQGNNNTSEFNKAILEARKG